MYLILGGFMKCTQMKWLFIIVCLSVLSVLCQLVDEDEEFKQKDFSHYIDPTNMIDYDITSQTMKNHQSMKTLEEVDDSTKADELPLTNDEYLSTLMATHKECQANMSRLQVTVASLNGSVGELKTKVQRCKSLTEQVFFVQYIRSILKLFKNFAQQMDVSDDGHYEVDIRMSTTQFNYLQNYADNEKGSLTEVHSVLLAMFHNSRWSTVVTVVDAGSSELWQQFKDYLFITAQAFIVLAAMLWMCKTLPRSPYWILSSLTLSLFLVSIPWNWWHLYKKEIASRHAELLKELPDSCKPNRQSLWNFVFHQLFLRRDDCARHLEKIEIDPFWEVTPSKALAVTFSKFFLEPAEHIGEAVNRLMVASFRDLPFYLFIPMYLLILITVIILALVVFGYRIRTPLFTLEPYRGDGRLEARNQAQTVELQDLKTQLAEKDAELEELRIRNSEMQQLMNGLQQRELLYQRLGQGDEVLRHSFQHSEAPVAPSNHGDANMTLPPPPPPAHSHQMDSSVLPVEEVNGDQRLIQVSEAASVVELNLVNIAPGDDITGQDIGHDFELLNEH